MCFGPRRIASRPLRAGAFCAPRHDVAGGFVALGSGGAIGMDRGGIMHVFVYMGEKRA